jgi:hypothetical protein
MISLSWLLQDLFKVCHWSVYRVTATRRQPASVRQMDGCLEWPAAMARR